jgi:hypothetical protein
VIVQKKRCNAGNNDKGNPFSALMRSFTLVYEQIFVSTLHERAHQMKVDISVGLGVFTMLEPGKRVADFEVYHNRSRRNSLVKRVSSGE